MADQDWTTVTFTKTNKQKQQQALSSQRAVAQAKAAGIVTTERRQGSAENKSAHTSTGMSARKLEEDNETFKHQTVNQNLAKSIVQARLAKKMTQAQLAQAINERPQIIQQYESGAAIPNPSIINKLDRALGTHLPRK